MISTEISPDTAALVEALSAVTPGQTITYAALSTVIGRDIKPVRYLLMAARKIVARDHGAVFATETRVGCRRLTTEEFHTVGHTVRTMVRRRVKGAAKLIRQGAAKANDISAIAGRKMNAELSALALIEHVSKDALAAPTKAHDERPEPVAVSARRLMEQLGLEVAGS